MIAALLALLLAQDPGMDALARQASDLPRAELGAHAGWQEREPPLTYLRALEAYSAEDLALCARELFACLESTPDHPAALGLLGGVYFRLRRYGDAVEAYERALAHAPETLARTRHLGHAYYSLGRYAEAARHYVRLLADEALADAARASVLRGLALARMRLGDVDGALAGLRAVLALEPEDGDAQYWLAQILFDDDRLDAALEHARTAQRLGPYDPRPRFLLARILAEEGDDEGARAARLQFERLAAADQRTRHLESVLLLAPTDLHSLRELARVRASIGDVTGTRAALGRVGAAELEDALLALDLLEPIDPRGAEAVAAIVERRHANRVEAWERLERFHGARGDVQSRLRCGARAAELRAKGSDR